MCPDCVLLRCDLIRLCRFFFFKQKTAYEMRISDWSSDVCSSDLIAVTDIVIVPSILLPPEGWVTGRHPELVAWLQIGRASCRERVCQYVQISVVAVSLKKK